MRKEVRFMKMNKLSFHTQRAKMTAKHNDRTMYRKSDGRFKDDTLNNLLKNDVFKEVYVKYGNYSINANLNNEQAEIEYLSNKYKDILEKTNQNYIKNGHKERVKTMRQYIEKNMGYETILQLGDANTNKDEFDKLVNSVALMEMNQIYVKELERLGMTVLSYNLHVDEESPHIHIRYAAFDDNNRMNRKSLLELSEYKTVGKESKFNNATVNFTNAIRDKLEDYAENIFEQQKDSLEIEFVRHSKGAKAVHKSVSEYKNSIEREKLLKSKIEAYNDELKALKLENENRQKQYKIASDMLHDEQRALQAKEKELRDKELQLKKKRDALENLEKTLNAKNNDVASIDSLVEEKKIELKDKEEIFNNKNNEYISLVSDIKSMEDKVKEVEQLKKKANTKYFDLDGLLSGFEELPTGKLKLGYMIQNGKLRDHLRQLPRLRKIVDSLEAVDAERKARLGKNDDLFTTFYFEDNKYLGYDDEMEL